MAGIEQANRALRAGEGGRSRGVWPDLPARWAGLLLVLVALAGGCSIVKGTTGTIRELRDDGVKNPSIGTKAAAGKTVVRVQYGSRAASSADVATLNAEATAVLRTVWTRLPFRFDEVQLVPEVPGEDPGTLTATRGELENQFGARPAALDRSPGDIGRRFATTALVILLTGMAVLIAVVLTILWLVRRGNRNRRVAPAFGTEGGAATWGAPTGAPPAWGAGAPPVWGAEGGSGVPPAPGVEAPSPVAADPPGPGRPPSSGPPNTPPPGFGPLAGTKPESGTERGSEPPAEREPRAESGPEPVAEPPPEPSPEPPPGPEPPESEPGRG